MHVPIDLKDHTAQTMVDFRIIYTLCIGAVRNADRMNQRRVRVWHSNQRRMRVWHFVGQVRRKTSPAGKKVPKLMCSHIFGL